MVNHIPVFPTTFIVFVESQSQNIKFKFVIREHISEIPVS